MGIITYLESGNSVAQDNAPYQEDDPRQRQDPWRSSQLALSGIVPTTTAPVDTTAQPPVERVATTTAETTTDDAWTLYGGRFTPAANAPDGLATTSGALTAENPAGPRLSGSHPPYMSPITMFP